MAETPSARGSGAFTGSNDRVTVLIVDDNPGDAELLAERLASANDVRLDVNFAASMAEALARLGTRRYDVVILDLNLPDSSGISTLRTLRAERPGLPFVVVSGIVDHTIRREALAAGAHEVISKDDANTRLFALSILYVVERNRAEGRRTHMERLLDMSPDAVLVVDSSGQVSYVNDAAVELFGRDRRELEQQALTLAAREGAPVQLNIPAADAERVGEMRVLNFEWQGERSSLAYIRDVTQQKKMELQLMLSDRMVSIGTLAAAVAHEINNPLAAVVANLDLIDRELAMLSSSATLPEALLEELCDAREAADQVCQIVRDLKVFSHPDDEAYGPVDVHSVIESTARMAWNEIRHRARLIKEFGDVPPVCANNARLSQVLLNLFVNAAQAIEEGDRAANEIRVVTGVDEQGRVTIAISDTGHGMSAEVQKRLFTPFFTTKPVGVGTGLGLAICRRIVGSLGGEMSFESAQGRGTCFRLALPAAPAADAASAPAPRDDQIASTARARILVIDDETAFLTALTRILESAHEVTGTDNAEEALERLATGEQFDLIFCDLMMPQLTGMEFYARVSEMNRGLEDRIVFLTGGAFTPSGRTFLDSVQNRCLEKPFDIQRLRSLIAELMSQQGDRPGSPAT